MGTEQKMPELPEFDVLHGSVSEGWSKTYSKRLVRRIQRQSIEYGRQQERERLEPLRMAVEAGTELSDCLRGLRAIVPVLLQGLDAYAEDVEINLKAKDSGDTVASVTLAEILVRAGNALDAYATARTLLEQTE